MKTLELNASGHQALINIEHPLRLSYANEDELDPNIWRVNMIVGQLDGWRNNADFDSIAIWNDATHVIRKIAASIAEDNAIIYASNNGNADFLTQVVQDWPAEECWIGTPHPGIPAKTPEHDVIALKNSLSPPPEFYPGAIYKCIQAKSFPDEKWWPGSRALLFPASPSDYRDRLECALQSGDYDQAFNMVYVSPGASSKFSPDISDFRSNKELLDSVKLYIMGGGPAKCVASANFYSKQVNLTEFIDRVLKLLSAENYRCYRSNGIETFKEWSTTGMLPVNLEMLGDL